MGVDSVAVDDHLELYSCCALRGRRNELQLVGSLVEAQGRLLQALHLILQRQLGPRDLPVDDLAVLGHRVQRLFKLRPSGEHG